MRFKLFLLVLLSAVMPVLAQTQTVKGTVLDATTEQPLIGALVTAGSSNTGVTTDLDGNFTIVVPQQVNVITVSYVNFDSQSVRIAGNDIVVRLMPTAAETDYYGDSQDLIFDEALLEDENENTQGIAALTGSNDDIYYNTASYNFGPMYFRYRGYDS